MLRFTSYLLSEVSLGGTSRKSGGSKWDFYLVPKWSKDDGDIYSVFSDGVQLLSIPATKDLKDLTISGPHSKGTKLEIISTDLKKAGKSDFANVKIAGNTGWIKVSQITKPDEKQDDGGILGGKNSKAFIPEKLDLNGKEFSSAAALVQSVSAGMKTLYGGDEFKEIRRYLSAFCEAIGGTALTEGSQERFTKTYTSTETFNVTKSDVMILSKNFGEVLGALYISKTNKKMKLIGFPSAGNEGLYDFYGKDKKGRTHFYSAKSAGGSSTSMVNLDFIKRNFSSDNSWLKKYASEMKAVDKLMNKGGANTIQNIIKWFKEVVPNKIKEILSIMSRGEKISSLEVVDTAIWLKAMRKKKKSEKEFLKIMAKVYKDVLWDIGKKKPQATISTLKDIFKNENKSEYDGGYIIYPMGSYIVAYMNRDDVKRTPDKPNKLHRFIDALDMLANFGSYISQITVDMDSKSTKIQILKFSKNKFRFSYNGMAKKPANRPIGFKEA